MFVASAGEGIYFAAKSGRMCAEAIVEASQKGKVMVGEDAFRVYLDKCVPGSPLALTAPLDVGSVRCSICTLRLSSEGLHRSTIAHDNRVLVPLCMVPN